MPLDRVPGEQDLYIGGIFSLRRYEALQAAKITHVVSVLRAPLDMELVKDYKHLMVEVDDVDDEYIIEHFKESNDFIAEGLAGGGGVLVHCAMGKSRSTTLLIAYLLSIHHNPTTSTVQEILDRIRQARSIAEPNSGFMEQLNLYASMGCPEDIHTQPAYQRWLYEQEVKNSIAVRQAPSNVYFADEAEINSHAMSQEGCFIEWKCRKCRRSLARDEFEAEHTPKTLPSTRQKAYHKSKPSSVAPTGQPDSPGSPISIFDVPAGTTQTRAPCAHIFLYPLAWMRDELAVGKLDGRLECPNGKCKANVGKYAWQGLQCNCGEWVVPGIALARGRVDEMKIKKQSGVGVNEIGGEGLAKGVGGLKI